ncbi:FixH family protein [Novosphingobium album (ex Liu et al. 2023)]|uniref:FixH family protein n=1 Tax=Novosphingobium album (ex Liu et al. 2023) TaxID=3031130 RepID=A0ABT5WMK0_9SPHN|nr:FixH family protein [Novosphingobium album (ex Liu et al. 2023)]MDE8651277.1 FixH family protein [Novosphingobium album (ex Liu et al. 2023)]
MSGTFTGRHMLAILVVGFGIVIAVNFTMATFAVRTFGGVVVENSYVASQEFNGWLKQAARSQALGWSVGATHEKDGRVALASTTIPADAVIRVEARHPLGTLPDRMLTFAPQGQGRWVSREPLPFDRWTLRFEVSQGPHAWREELPLS